MYHVDYSLISLDFILFVSYDLYNSVIISFIDGPLKMSSMRQENGVLYLLLEEIIHQSIIVISCVIDHMHKKNNKNVYVHLDIV